MSGQEPLPLSKYARRCRVLGLAAAGALIAMAENGAFAASGSWSGAGPNNDWNNALNWNFVPGANNGTFVSPDIATFSNTANRDSVTVDTNRNVLGLTFNTPATGTAFAVGTLAANGGNTLYLSNGGTITVAATNATAASIAIQAPLVLAGTSYTMISNSTTASAGLKLHGGLTGGASGATTLSLDGVNNSGSTQSNSQILGPITNGASSSLSVVKNGTGVWEMRPTFGANTYSGDTIINGGVLRLMATVESMSPNSNYIVNNGGTLRPNITGITGKSIKVNSGGIVQASNDNIITSLNTNSGPSLWFNFTTTTGAIAMGVPVNFTGTTPGQGGFKLSNQDATSKVSYSKGIDLGAVARPFDIAQSALNAAGDDPDLQINGAVNGTGGGIIKIGPGALKLNNSANAFTGTLEVQQGIVRFNSDNALTAKPAVVINGGDLDVSSFTQTVGPLQLNSGTISESSSGTGKVATSSISMNVPTGASAKCGAILANSTSPAALTKSGDGSATLTASNTYTGGTTVHAGTLRIATTGTIANGNLTVDGTGLVHVAAGRVDPIKVAALSVTASGVVDLNDNDMIVTATSRANVTAMIRNARNGNNWNQPGITSTSARNTPGRVKGLGVLSGAEYTSVAGASSFGGLSFTATDLLVKYTWNGDTDFDDQVDFDDYFRIDNGFNHQTEIGAVIDWFTGDFNYDGRIDFDDYALIDNAFNAQFATLSRALAIFEGGSIDVSAPALAMVQQHLNQFGSDYAQAFIAAVPEPTCAIGMSLFTALPLHRPRRRRHR